MKRSKESKADLIFALSLMHSKRSKEINNIFIPYDQPQFKSDYAFFLDPIIDELINELERAKNDKVANKIIQKTDNRRKCATILCATQFNVDLKSIALPFSMLASVMGIKNEDGFSSFSNIRMDNKIIDNVVQSELLNILDDFNRVDEEFKKNLEKNKFYFHSILNTDDLRSIKDLSQIYIKKKDEPEKYFVRAYSTSLEDYDWDDEDSTPSAYMLDCEIFSNIDVLKKEAKEILDDIKGNPHNAFHQNLLLYLNQEKTIQFINTVIEDISGLTFSKDTKLRLISDIYGIRDSTSLVPNYMFKYEHLNDGELFENRVKDIDFINQNERELNAVLGIPESKDYPDETYCKLAVSYTVASRIDLIEFQKNFADIRALRPNSGLYADEEMNGRLDEFIDKIQLSKMDQDNYEDDELPLAEIIYAVNRSFHTLVSFDYEDKLLTNVEEFFEVFKDALNTHNQSFDNFIFEDASKLVTKLKNSGEKSVSNKGNPPQP